MNPHPHKRGGFTLIEVMGVVALIGFVFFVALNFYTELANAANRASHNTRGVRRASAILDRVARDIEGAFLMVKPADVDPFAFPWIFLGQARLGGSTADQLKFITRNHDPTRTDSPETNLATVAYVVESGEGDSISLYRWTSPRLPESLNKDFPREGDEGTYLMAEGLRDFGFYFIPEEGDLRTEWDSSTVLESSSLPKAVEIRLSMMDDSDYDDESPVYTRRVLIPVRPIDLEVLLDPEGLLGGTGEDGDDDEPGEDGDENNECVAGEMTNACCFPSSVPDSAPTNAKLCVGLAKSAPDMKFSPDDYRGLPEECKAVVNPECR